MGETQEIYCPYKRVLTCINEAAVAVLQNNLRCIVKHFNKLASSPTSNYTLVCWENTNGLTIGQVGRIHARLKCFCYSV